MSDRLIKICALALVIAVAGVPAAVMGATATNWFVPLGFNQSIEDLVINGTDALGSGDTITLLEDGVNTTLEAGNVTEINVATLTFRMNGFPIYLNGSLTFTGTGNTINFYTDNGTTTLADVVFNASCASTAGVFNDNASAVHIIGNGNNIILNSLAINGTGSTTGVTLLNISGSSLTEDLNISGLTGTSGGFTTGVRIGGNSNTVNLTGTAANLLSAFNVSGTGNKINVTASGNYIGKIATSVDTAFNVSGTGNTIMLEGAGTLDTPTIGFEVFGTGHKILLEGTGAITTTGTTFNITGGSNTITASSSSTIKSTGGTAVNLTGDGNYLTLNLGTLTGAKTAINITGNSNTVTQATGVTITSTNGPGINISGNTNILTIYSADISASAGKIFLDGTASGNTINDGSFAGAVPTVWIYNASTFNTTPVWFFYNSSWSPDGLNSVPCINVSGIPISGPNVNITANFSNMTGQYTGAYTQENTTTTVDTTTGLSGGFIFNYTSPVVFRQMESIIPVNFSFGRNHYAGQYESRNIGWVTIMNFDPVHSLPSYNFNTTYTSNWSDIDDYTIAPQLEFARDYAASGSLTRTQTLLGNLTFTGYVNLTDQNVGNALSALGNSLAIAASSIDLTMANTAMEAFNTTATLTVYPTAFSFSTADDLTLIVTDDAGTSTTLWTAGAWSYLKANYTTATSLTVTANNNIVLPVTHFSKYTFSKYTAPSPAPTPSGGGGSSTAIAVSSGIKAGENVYLNLDTSYSALSRVIITAKENINTILITAEKTALPKSIEAPGNNVYQYIEVTPYKVTDASIAQAVLDFDVKKSWLDQNGYGIGDIVMMRYHDGEWQQLTTEFVKEANGIVYYRALSPGLSYFAIANVDGGTVTGEETPVIPVPTELGPPATTPAPAATTAPPAEATPTPGFAAVAALVGLGAAAFIVLRRR